MFMVKKGGKRQTGEWGKGGEKGRKTVKKKEKKDFCLKKMGGGG